MITKNHCLMILRNKGKIPVELNEQTVKSPEETMDKGLLIEKDMLLTKMESCLMNLNAEQQQCVILFYLEKKSYTEISDITGFSLMQVKSYIQNGKRNLKLMMSN